MYFLAQEKHICALQKGQITFFHFKLNSIFFSAISYLIRSHPAYWVASSDNSEAIPLTHLSTLLDVAVGTTGLCYRICVCRKKNVLAYYFPSHSPKEEISHCVSKGPPEEWLYGFLSEVKGMEKARLEGNLDSILQD